MSRFFEVGGELMYEPNPTAGTAVVRKATDAEKRARDFKSVTHDVQLGTVPEKTGLWATVRNWIT